MGFSFATIRESFLDSEAVQKKVAKAKRRVLSKCGAFVRRRARSSIRKRKKSAAPGQPPSSHSGELKKLLFFAYDSATQSVVVGPVPFGGASVPGIPSLLERGGSIAGNGRVFFKKRAPGRDAKGHFVSAGTDRIEVHGNIVYRGNPFMKPAFDAERPKFVSQFKDML